MMAETNMLVLVLAFVYAVLIGHLVTILKILLSHSLFAFHMISLGVLSMVGQMFVYHMIKQLKQHIVPFIITTRKIFTVGVSFIYFRHAINIEQILWLNLFFCIITYEFMSELMQDSS